MTAGISRSTVLRNETQPRTHIFYQASERAAMRSPTISKSYPEFDSKRLFHCSFFNFSVNGCSPIAVDRIIYTSENGGAPNQFPEQGGWCRRQRSPSRCTSLGKEIYSELLCCFLAKRLALSLQEAETGTIAARDTESGTGASAPAG